jgi:hypothetical protein
MSAFRRLGPWSAGAENCLPSSAPWTGSLQPPDERSKMHTIFLRVRRTSFEAIAKNKGGGRSIFTSSRGFNKEKRDIVGTQCHGSARTGCGCPKNGVFLIHEKVILPGITEYIL